MATWTHPACRHVPDAARQRAEHDDPRLDARGRRLGDVPAGEPPRQPAGFDHVVGRPAGCLHRFTQRQHHGSRRSRRAAFRRPKPGARSRSRAARPGPTAPSGTTMTSFPEKPCPSATTPPPLTVDRSRNQASGEKETRWGARIEAVTSWLSRAARRGEQDSPATGRHNDSTTEESSHGPKRCASATTTTPPAPAVRQTRPADDGRRLDAGDGLERSRRRTPGCDRADRAVPSGGERAEGVESGQAIAGTIGQQCDRVRVLANGPLEPLVKVENRRRRIQRLRQTPGKRPSGRALQAPACGPARRRERNDPAVGQKSFDSGLDFGDRCAKRQGRAARPDEIASAASPLPGGDACSPSTCQPTVRPASGGTAAIARPQTRSGHRRRRVGRNALARQTRGSRTGSRDPSPAGSAPQRDGLREGQSARLAEAASISAERREKARRTAGSMPARSAQAPWSSRQETPRRVVSSDLSWVS